MNLFLFGAVAMAWVVAGLFFLRFWKETNDRLFLFFAAAFWTLAVNRLAMALAGDPGASEVTTVPYLIRLLAYGLILVAIWDKNRRGRSMR